MSTMDLLHTVEGVALLYTATYLLLNLGLILAGARPALDQVRERGFLDLDLLDDHDSTVPRIAILVPAFDEQTTIVPSVRSLMAVDYPDLELVVVNDGSRDRTASRLRRAFGMHRRDLPVRHELPSARIRALYECSHGLPANVSRLVLVDKENGGRSDALNAALSVCLSPIVLTVDADCLVDPEALKHLVRIMQGDPDIAAVGGQVGVVNDCTVTDGRVTRARVPRQVVPLCQTVEYLRAFSVMRTGFSRLGSLVILSGAFMLLRREVAVEVGGFLTGRSPSRLLAEHVGAGRSTICEDMELIVRIHRNLRERGERGRVVHAPVPLIWTEVPPTLDSLAKQRRRWHRGLLEILWMHRKMIYDPRYGRIGLFSLPYFLWFEALGPWIEAIGLFLLPLLAIIGVLDPLHAGLITGIALGAGVLQSLAAILVTTWMEPSSIGGLGLRSLLGADRWADRLRLLGGAFLSEMGYRQLTVLWRLRATFEFLRGYEGWDKFERKGFGESVATASSVAVLAGGLALGALTGALGAALAPGEADAAWSEPSRGVTVVVGAEQRDEAWPSWWTEAVAKWIGEEHRARWAGAYTIERDGRTDAGLVLGFSPGRWQWGGFGLEARFAPAATFSPVATFAGETEFRAVGRLSGSVRVRQSFYEDLRIGTTMVGGVLYLIRNAWWSHHAVFVSSHFDTAEDDLIVGYATRLHLEEFGLRWELDLRHSGESFLVDELRSPRDIRATVFGLQLGIPIEPVGEWIVGAHHRRPERGATNLYLHTGLRRGF